MWNHSIHFLNTVLYTLIANLLVLTYFGFTHKLTNYNTNGRSVIVFCISRNFTPVKRYSNYQVYLFLISWPVTRDLNGTGSTKVTYIDIISESTIKFNDNMRQYNNCCNIHWILVYSVSNLYIYINWVLR